MDYETILVRRADAALVITMNRPERRNAINSKMMDELVAALRGGEGDDEVRAVIITGGSEFFSAGADLKEAGERRTAVDAMRMLKSWRRVTNTLEELARPVIAAIEGFCLTGGLELALACDIRIASATARFGLTQLQHGLMPHQGGTQRLPRLIGRGKALELILTGAIFDSAEAARIGLVSQVAPATEAAEEASKLALRMAAMAPYSLRFAKEAINKGMDMTMDQGLRLEADLYFLMQTTRDRVEGITCYLQKKAPHFEGR